MIVTIYADGGVLIESAPVSVAPVELIYDMDVHPRLAVTSVVDVGVDDAGATVGWGH